MWGELTSKASVLPVYAVTPAARAGGRPDGETHGRRQVLRTAPSPGQRGHVNQGERGAGYEAASAQPSGTGPGGRGRGLLPPSVPALRSVPELGPTEGRKGRTARPRPRPGLRGGRAGPC